MWEGAGRKRRGSGKEAEGVGSWGCIAEETCKTTGELICAGATLRGRHLLGTGHDLGMDT